MKIKEFKHFCENQLKLKELWNNLVSCALYLQHKQFSFALKLHSNEDISNEEKKEYKELYEAFNNAKTVLEKECKNLDIKMPLFNVNEFCSLYVYEIINEYNLLN